MRSKISVIGELTHDLRAVDVRADVTHVEGDAYADCAGSEVVVLTDGADVPAAAAAVARRAGAAVLVVATPDFEADTAVALSASLLPRPRVFGVTPDAAAEAVEAVLFGRGVPLTVAACVDDTVELTGARVGAGGLQALG